MEAQETFSRLASLLAASHSVSKSKATADIYGRLNLTLTRSVARAILASQNRCYGAHIELFSVSFLYDVHMLHNYSYCDRKK